MFWAEAAPASAMPARTTAAAMPEFLIKVCMGLSFVFRWSTNKRMFAWVLFAAYLGFQIATDSHRHGSEGRRPHSTTGITAGGSQVNPSEQDRPQAARSQAGFPTWVASR
jgi:hypothetical protein